MKESKPNVSFKAIRNLKKAAEKRRIAGVRKKYKKIEEQRKLAEKTVLKEQRKLNKNPKDKNTPKKKFKKLKETRYSLMKKDYNEYLNSLEWKMIRGEVLNERKCICEKCFNEFPKFNLHVHHMTYKRFKHEEKSDLAVLCVKCHKEVHKIGKKNNPFFI